ncbi:MAG: PilZ domain-containing protein [Spirochaetia bacterium]|nr:PilZ domain-containing protein [Spirochaetia bacterium]
MNKTAIITNSKETENLTKFAFERERLELNSFDHIKNINLNDYNIIFIDEKLYYDFKLEKHRGDIEIFIFLSENNSKSEINAANISGFIQTPVFLDNISGIIGEIKNKAYSNQSKRKDFRYDLSHKAAIIINENNYECVIQNLSKGGFQTQLVNFPEYFQNIKSGKINFKTSGFSISENFAIRWSKKDDSKTIIGAEWSNLSEQGAKNIVNLLLESGTLFAEID